MDIKTETIINDAILHNKKTEIEIVIENDEDAKQIILDRFNTNVKDKEISSINTLHNGAFGHWLETQMGVIHNCRNEPDLFGFEMKTGDNVTTGIDKAPDIFYINGVDCRKGKTKLPQECKKEFWNKYASQKQSEDKTIGGWKINEFNKCGQKIVVDEDNNIKVLYDYNYDTRDNKEYLELLKTPHIIMKWKVESLRSAINNKFNKRGFFKCIKEGNKYTKICFGSPFTFETWIEEFKKGVIYHDGYSKLKGRGRHVFRASNNKFWDKLIRQVY
jgi:hypothetical protein